MKSTRWLCAGAVAVCLGACGCESHEAGADSRLPLRIVATEVGTGHPVAEIACTVRSGAHLVARGTTDERGILELPHAFVGPVSLQLRDPARRYVPQTVAVSWPGVQAVQLAPGVEVALKITDEQGVGLGSAAVVAWTSGSQVRGVADESGAVTLKMVPAGSAKLVVTAPGHRTAVFIGRIAKPKEGDLQDLGAVRLKRGGATLRGRVVASSSVLPRVAAVRFQGVAQYARIGPDGTFCFEGLPADTESETFGGDMLVLMRGSQEVYARDIRLDGTSRDVGTIRLD